MKGKRSVKRGLALLLAMSMMVNGNILALAQEEPLPTGVETEVSEEETPVETPETEDEQSEETDADKEGKEDQDAQEETDKADDADKEKSDEDEALDADQADESVEEEKVAEEVIKEPENLGEESSNQIEINQAMSIHVGNNDGNETYMNDFVAKKRTAIMMKIPGSDADGFDEAKAKEAVKNYSIKVKAVTNGQEADNDELTASGDSFEILRTYDKDCDVTKGYYAAANFPQGPDKGTYNIHWYDGENEIATNNGVNFFETQTLNILVVPVDAYWSAKYDGGAPSQGNFKCTDLKYFDNNGNEKEWSSLCADLKEYLLDVYPVADINLEEGKEITANTAEYDMVTSDGQKKLWEEACKLQTKDKESGKDKYDLILAFVAYRQDQGGGQGFTYGKPTNIITYTDKDMLPTVAHEIAHCYQVGDEYDGGSFNNDVNRAPNGYKGRNYVSGEDIASNSGTHEYWKAPKEYKATLADDNKVKARINENGAGTMVSPSLHTYSLSQKQFIKWAGLDSESGEVYPTISYMGSGYSGSNGYYFTSSIIWEHLFKQLLVKEKKEASQEQSQESEGQSLTNAEVYYNSVAENPDGFKLFDENDFYFGDDYREGDSRMVEVSGWLVQGEGGAITVDMDPMFSYDGDLSYMDWEEVPAATAYTFAAVDEKGNVIESPVDGEWAATEFDANFYNPRTKNGTALKELSFTFDAEYPEGTADLVIIKGKLAEDGSYNASNKIWSAANDQNLKADFSKNPEGYLTYAEVNDKVAEVEWEVYYPADAENPYDGKSGELYTEVYYCPQGDEGEVYYIACSDDPDWEEGAIAIDTTNTKDGYGWSRDAYVWIKVTNGVNAWDIYSDENDVSVTNSTIALAGVKAVKDAKGNVTYTTEYTGKEITPNTTVKAYNPETGTYIALVKGTDYTVKYEDNIKAGTAKVIVEGIGVYAGRNTKEFTITKKALAGTPQNIPDMTYSDKLDEEIIKYLVIVDNKKNQLVYDTDFSVKYTANGTTKKTLKELITAKPESKVTVTAVFTGKGNYEKECKTKVKFDIVPDGTSLAGAVITLAKTEVEYTGNPVTSAVKKVEVKDAEGNLVKLPAAKYKVVYTNNTQMGKARVTVVGKGGYVGTASTTFTIVPKQVAALTVTGVNNQPFTGSDADLKAMSIVVKAGNITLKEGVDYTVSLNKDCDNKNMTTQQIINEKKQPQVEVRLITLTDAERAAKKASECPKVVWKSNVKDDKKVAIKKFKIVAAKLNSTAMTTVTLKNSDASKNVVTDKKDGKKDATELVQCTMEKAPKADQKKYMFVIKGEQEFLYNTADVSKAIVIKALGKELNPDYYTITITKTKTGKTGKITIAPKSVVIGKKPNGTDLLGKPYTGNRVIKFKYEQVDKQTPPAVSANGL